MTLFEDYLNTAATNSLSWRDQRKGQAYMNTLHLYDVDTYAYVTGSSLDPFYDDSRVPAFLTYLAGIWEGVDA